MKHVIIVLLLTLGCGLYLNRAYVHIFSFISAKQLVNPTTHMSLVVSPPSHATKKVTYVALGDSLTAGVGATSEDKTYPYLLAKILAEKQNAQVTVINLGQPGATAADILIKQIPAIAKFHPDIVTLAIGVNDMHNRVPAGQFQRTINAIVNNLASSTKHINIINIPYVGSGAAFLPPYRAYFNWKTKHYNNLLYSALAKQRVHIIDLYSLTRGKAFTDPQYYSPDGFHPSDEAYDFWSKIIYDHLDY